MTRTYGFIHIPKTAGRAFVTAMLKACPQDTINTGTHSLAHFPYSFEDAPRIVTGHIPRYVFDWMGEGRQLATVLRHPVRRVLSGYVYAATCPDHPAHLPFMFRRNRPPPTLAECYQNPYMRTEFSDFMTRTLGFNASAKEKAWPVNGLIPGGPFNHSLTEFQYVRVDANTLTRAMAHIGEGRIKAAILERPETVLALASEMAGVPVPEIPRINQTQPVPWRPTADDIALIEAHNRCDIALYEFTLKRHGNFSPQEGHP